jgi:hypothetical protein
MEANQKAVRFMQRSVRRVAAVERSCESCDNSLDFKHLNVTLCARRLADELPAIAVERSTGACGPEGKHWKMKKEA